MSLPDAITLKPKLYLAVPHLVPTLAVKELKEEEQVELQYSPRKVLLKGTSLVISPG